jgi:hypothetical protein
MKIMIISNRSNAISKFLNILIKMINPWPASQPTEVTVIVHIKSTIELYSKNFFKGSFLLPRNIIASILVP